MGKSDCEKDLGIFIESDLKWEVQVAHCTSKANKLLGMIKRSFSFPNVSNVALLYKSLVRPHLEQRLVPLLEERYKSTRKGTKKSNTIRTGTKKAQL